jgi:hypothetical protein
MPFVYAKQTFADTTEHPHRIIAKGQRYDSKDAVVKHHRWAFESEQEIESASAAPGEKRSTRRPAGE